MKANILYDAVEVTRGINGYPKNLYHATAGFTNFEEAEDYAKRNNGTVVLLHRKDGWQLWEKLNNLYSAPLRTVEDEGDDYEFFTSADKEQVERNYNFYSEGEDAEDINFAEYYKDILARISTLNEGEALVFYCGKYAETIKLNPMNWHDFANNEYLVAVE